MQDERASRVWLAACGLVPAAGSATTELHEHTAPATATASASISPSHGSPCEDNCAVIGLQEALLLLLLRLGLEAACVWRKAIRGYARRAGGGLLLTARLRCGIPLGSRFRKCWLNLMPANWAGMVLREEELAEQRGNTGCYPTRAQIAHAPVLASVPTPEAGKRGDMAFQ